MLPQRTIVTVSSSDGTKFKTFTVIVKKKQIPAEKIILDKESLTLEIGDTAKLTATVTPSNTTDGDVTWYSNDESIVTVDENGNITAVSAGNTAVAAYCGKTAVGICNITVSVPVISVNAKSTSITVKVDTVLDYNEYFEIFPANATNKELIFTEQNVDESKEERIKTETLPGYDYTYKLAVKPGMVLIIARSASDKTKYGSLLITIVE